MVKFSGSLTACLPSFREECPAGLSDWLAPFPSKEVIKVIKTGVWVLIFMALSGGCGWLMVETLIHMERAYGWWAAVAPVAIALLVVTPLVHRRTPKQ
jgi:hypothetical protein